MCKQRFKLQTRNLEWLGGGERAIERAGGLGGIRASVHTSQHARRSENGTLFCPWSGSSQNAAKKVLSRRLTASTKGREVREEMKGRVRKGTRKNLYDVSLCEDTYPNPKNSGTKA